MNVYKTSTIRLTLTSSNAKIVTSSKNKNFLVGKLISSYIRDTGLARMIHALDTHGSQKNLLES